MAMREQSDVVWREQESETTVLDGSDEYDTVNGVVDYKGRPVFRRNAGRWRSACFIIGGEVTERMAYYGIQSNLISYLTEQLQQSTAMAATNVNVWIGTASLLPLFGAFLADSYIGRYRTIIIASFLYILGLGLLTLSAMLPSLTNSECQIALKPITPCPSKLHAFIFFFSLYLVALAQAGHKPCTQAFGADQFDEHHPNEAIQRSSFFNWWYFTSCAFCSLTLWILNYVQDNFSWVLGFGIPCVLMISGLIFFFLGTKTYRFITIDGDDDNKVTPFIRIGRVFFAAMRNCRTSVSESDIAVHQCSQQLNFLNKALLAPNDESKEEKPCSLNEVEEAKALLRLAPIWATSLVYGIASAQVPTFFTKQGITMDRTIFQGFNIPSASLQFLIPWAIILFTPIYDCIIVKLAKPNGITMLKRIGIGMLISVITLVIAALVETKRLKEAAKDDDVLMSVWWLIPQYLLFGVADVFTIVGLQEFFYDQVPNGLRSVGVALYLSVLGVGSFLSSFLIYVIEKLSGEDGGKSWFSDDINEGHLDYFYWLLAGLSVIAFGLYIWIAKSYIYYQRRKKIYTYNTLM